MTTRRKFLENLGKASAFAFLPLSTQDLFARPPLSGETIIDAVEILRISGPYTSTPGLNRQYQAQPIHIFPELHPAPYKDDPNPKESKGTTTQHYIRIKTKGGFELAANSAGQGAGLLLA